MAGAQLGGALTETSPPPARHGKDLSKCTNKILSSLATDQSPRCFSIRLRQKTRSLKAAWKRLVLPIDLDLASDCWPEFILSIAHQTEGEPTPLLYNRASCSGHGKRGAVPSLYQLAAGSGAAATPGTGRRGPLVTARGESPTASHREQQNWSTGRDGRDRETLVTPSVAADCRVPIFPLYGKVRLMTGWQSALSLGAVPPTA